jgi:hypothetical protein
MSIETLEAMIPVRLSGAKERLSGARFALLLESLSRHWRDVEPLTLTVVGLGDELPKLRRLAGRRANLSLQFLDERELLPHSGLQAVPGWHKQIFLKLLFASICRSDAYLYLDADVICVRPLGRADMLHEGRIISGWEPKHAHAGWWEGSRRMLGRTETQQTSGLSVTPNVFARELVRAIPAAVAAATGRNPVEALIEAIDYSTVNCWVEQGLYTELGEMTGALERLHAPMDGKSPYHSKADVWDAKQLAAWTPLKTIAASQHTKFVVVQSTLGVSPTWLRLRLAPLLWSSKSQ